MSSQRTQSENTGQATVMPRARRWLTMKRADFDQGLQNVLLSLVNFGNSTATSWYPPFMELEEYTNPDVPRSLAIKLSSTSVSKYTAFVTPSTTNDLPPDETQKGQECIVTLQPYVNSFQVSEDTWAEFQSAVRSQNYPYIYLGAKDAPQPGLLGTEGVARRNTDNGGSVALPLAEDEHGIWNFTGFFGDYFDCWLEVGSQKFEAERDSGNPLRIGVRFSQKDIAEGASDSLRNQFLT